MHGYCCSCSPLNVGCLANVIDMRMGNDNLANCQLMLLHQSHDGIDICAGVYDNRIPGIFVAEDGTVALERTDCNNFVNHLYTRQYMDEVVSVIIRAVHILSIVMLLGSAFYIRFVEKGVERIPAWYVLLPVVGVIFSGGWQFWTTIQTGGVDKGWHMVFGIKMLFVMHILAISLLQLRTVDEDKRKRWMTGIVASGVLVTILSATMRLLHA